MIKSKKIIFAIFISLFIIFLPACINKKINTKNIANYSMFYQTGFEEELDGINLKVIKLNAQESSMLFNVNMLKYNIQPILIFIQNNSNGTLYFNPELTRLPFLTPEEVAKRCHWRNSEITGFASYVALFYLWQALFPIAYTSYEMRKQNKQITEMVSDSALNSWDSIKLLPLQNLKKIIFLEKLNTPNSFIAPIFSKETKKTIHFHVQLNNND